MSTNNPAEKFKKQLPAMLAELRNNIDAIELISRSGSKEETCLLLSELIVNAAAFQTLILKHNVLVASDDKLKAVNTPLVSSQPGQDVETWVSFSALMQYLETFHPGTFFRDFDIGMSINEPDSVIFFFRYGKEGVHINRLELTDKLKRVYYTAISGKGDRDLKIYVERPEIGDLLKLRSVDMFFAWVETSRQCHERQLPKA